MGRKRRQDFGALIEELGWSPVELAAESRVSVATIYRARQGILPGAVLVAALAGALGVTEARVERAIEASLQLGAA